MNLTIKNETIQSLKNLTINLIDVVSLELSLLKKELMIKAIGPFHNDVDVMNTKREVLEKETKKTLYERAKNKDISGRSTMDKKQLISALVNS